MQYVCSYVHLVIFNIQRNCHLISNQGATRYGKTDHYLTTYNNPFLALCNVGTAISLACLSADWLLVQIKFCAVISSSVEQQVILPL